MFCLIFGIVQARNTTKAAMKLLDDILDIFVAYQVAGQEPAVLSSDRMSALVAKVDYKNLAGSSFSIGGGSFVLPSNEDVMGSLVEEDCYIVAKVQGFTQDLDPTASFNFQQGN